MSYFILFIDVYKTKLPEEEENLLCDESNNANNELGSSFESNEDNGDSVANDNDCDDDDDEDDDEDEDEEEDEENDDDQGSGRASEDPTGFEGEESNMAPSTVR